MLKAAWCGDMRLRVAQQISGKGPGVAPESRGAAPDGQGPSQLAGDDSFGGGLLWSGDEDQLPAYMSGLADTVGLGGAVERVCLHLDDQLVLGQQVGR